MKKTIKILEWVITFGIGLAIYFTLFESLFPVYTAEEFIRNPKFCIVLNNVCIFFMGYLALTLGDILYYSWAILLIKYKDLLKEDSE